MYKRKLEILSYIKSHGSIEWYTILNAFDPAKNINETHAILDVLLSEKLIEKCWPNDSPPRCSVKLSNAGKVYLGIESEKQQELQKLFNRMDKEHEERIASERKSKYVSIINTLICAFTLIATVVFGYLSSQG